MKGRPAPVVEKPAKVPPLSQIWGNPASLPDHFARHGGDFGAKSAEEYAGMAWKFLQRAKAEGLPAKYDDSDGTLRVWDPKTRTFAAYHRDGRAKTFFKPDSRGYFDRQPGKSVKL
jgi:pyocin large subunit-like protein